MSTPKSNGDFLADLYRQEMALRSPKMHIPLGIGVFMVLASMSPIAWLPFAGAGLVAYDAERRLRKNRKTVETSYRNPQVLFEKLKKDEKELVSAFLDQYPVDAPFGTKKALPPVAQKMGNPSRDEGDNAPQQQSTGGEDSPTPPVDVVLPDTMTVTGWQPQALPVPDFSSSHSSASGSHGGRPLRLWATFEAQLRLQHSLGRVHSNRFWQYSYAQVLCIIASGFVGCVG